MSKLREPVISNCEKSFTLKCLSENMRLDGRAFDEFRDFSINFGIDWGCCYVSLGQTSVIAQVSCEVQSPNPARLSEGILNINVELNPMGAPHFEPTRQSDLSVQLNGTLEKCIKDSKAIDLESLCLKMKEKVWAIRVDINILNHEGNLLDCASVAALSALAHFRRPDVTCDGEEIIVHSPNVKDFIPLVIHHYPVCNSFAVFNNGDTIIADPTLLEENVSDAHVIVGLNAYRELCGLHIGGNAQLAPDSIVNITAKASRRANVVIEMIKKALENDTEKRLKNDSTVGFQHSLFTTKEIQQLDSLEVCLDTWTVNKNDKNDRKRKHKVISKIKSTKMEVDSVASVGVVEKLKNGSAALVPIEKESSQQWQLSEGDESEEDEVMEEKKVVSESTIILSDGSEEEEVIVLNADKKTNKKKMKNNTNSQ